MSTAIPHRQRALAFCALTCLVCYTLFFLKIHDGYIPVDDPLQAHTAERVLHGQMPNVDFHDVYTGGLAYLNALSLRLFGTRLLSLRLMLFLFLIVWVPSIWYLASRIISPLCASFVTLLTVVWSVPNYPTPLGSWYNLFFATFAILATVLYLESSHRRWLFVAGLMVGFSILAKIAGLYLLAAVGLFLLFLEQESRLDCEPARGIAARYYSLLLSLAFTTLLAAELFLIRRANSASEWYHFIVPSAALLLMMLVREWSTMRHSFRVRFTAIQRLAFPYLLGIVSPIFLFLIPYLHRGALKMWFVGVFVLPQERLGFAMRPPLDPAGAITCMPLLLVVLLDSELHTRTSRWIALFLVSCIYGIAFVFCFRSVFLVRLVWMSFATIIPILAIFTSIKIARLRTAAARESQLLVLFAMAAGLCSLIQFPFSHLMYFCYVAPLMILTLSAVFAGRSLTPLTLLTPVLVFYMLFGVLVLLPNQIYARGLTLSPLEQKAFILPRGKGLAAPIEIVDSTEEACRELLKHAQGMPIYAGPDSPQFYFLTGLRNPTPNLIEVLAGSDGFTDNILADIRGSGVKAVLINHTPDNDSGVISSELADNLRKLFPESRNVGLFEVRWRQ